MTSKIDTIMFKYPRTYHVPWSQTITNDDKILTLKELECFKNLKVSLSIKMDGECTTLYTDYYHARSIDSKHHESRSYVKQLHDNIKHLIPNNWRICGENLYAKHSIYYDNLDSYFMVYSIWNENNICLSLKETLEWCQLLELFHVPIIDIIDFNIEIIKEYCNKFDTNENEGIVIRNIESFHYKYFKYNVSKFVRKDHIQSDNHWMYSKLTINKLKEKKEKI